MSKIQITLTNQEANILSDYGLQFGYNLSKTARFILGKAAEEHLESKTTVYKLSDSGEAKGLKALEEDRKGKTIEVSNFKEFFNQ
jgi:hypothetical protein